MYTHLTKGFTVGQLLMRRLLRFICSLPGMGLDFLVAFFWVGHNYKDYWRDAYLLYADDTRVGFCEGLFGWIGEASGFILGGLLGSVLGLVVYGVDSALSFVRYVQENLYNAFDA